MKEGARRACGEKDEEARRGRRRELRFGGGKEVAKELPAPRMPPPLKTATHQAVEVGEEVHLAAQRRGVGGLH